MKISAMACLSRFLLQVFAILGYLLHEEHVPGQNLWLDVANHIGLLIAIGQLYTLFSGSLCGIRILGNIIFP